MEKRRNEFISALVARRGGKRGRGVKSVFSELGKEKKERSRLLFFFLPSPKKKKGNRIVALKEKEGEKEGLISSIE